MPREQYEQVGISFDCTHHMPGTKFDSELAVVDIKKVICSHVIRKSDK
jgi:hypothetical protein